VVEEPTLEQARLLLAAKRPDDALQALSRDPDTGEAWMLRAQAFIQKGQMKAALHASQRAAALMPEDSRPQAFRSLLLLPLGHPIQALKAGREAIRLDPNDEVAHYALARAAINWGRWDEAKASASTAMRLAPELTGGYTAAGALELKLGQAKEAEAFFRDAVRVDPSDAEAISDLATALARQGRDAEARQIIESAARTDPSSEEVMQNLYRRTYHYVSGGEVDRLDAIMWPAFGIAVTLDAMIVLGWLHPPAIVTAAVFALTLILVIVFSVLDTIRNRRRMKSLSDPLQAHFRRSLMRDWRRVFGFLLYFIASFGIPAILFGVLGSAIGLPAVVMWAAVAALLIAWLPAGGWLWFRFVRRIVVGEV